MPELEEAVSPAQQEVLGGPPAAPSSDIGVVRILSRDQILNAQDVISEPVAVPEWGGTVIVRCLTGKERDEWEDAMIDRSAKRGKNQPAQMTFRNIRAGLVARSCVDSEGRRLFSERDVDALAQKSAAALDRVYEVAARLSGISDKDVDELAESFSEGSEADGSSPTP